MALNSISGSRLRQIVMHASGTKGYMSSSVQKHLQDTKTKRFLHEDTKVTRQQATKIIKGMKEAGLAHKVDTNATEYVKKSFAKEARRQDMIKKQNLAERNQQMAAEKAAEQAKAGKGGKAPAPKAIKAVHLATGSVSAVGNQPAPNQELIGTSFGSTNLKSASGPNSLPKLPLTKTIEPEPIDLVID